MTNQSLFKYYKVFEKKNILNYFRNYQIQLDIGVDIRNKR